MARLTFFVALVVVACVSSSAQQFSTDPEYVAFYRSRFNAEFESTREPTLSLWWIIEKFADPKVRLEKLADLLLAHSELFPDSEYAGHVESHLTGIKRMLAEKRPPDDEKVEQLIFDLRDLNLRQWQQPNDGLGIVGMGSLRFADQLNGPNPNPDAVRQLCDVGYDAVPALIEHIDDDTLTRSVDFWRDFTFSHRVLTVGECCSQILDEILPTGRLFELSDDPTATKQAMKNHYRHLIAQKRAEQSETHGSAKEVDVPVEESSSPGDR